MIDQYSKITEPMKPTRKTKLSIVMPGHWTDVMGGAQYQVDCLISALLKNGNYEISYITRNYDPAFKPIGYQLIGIPKPFGRSRGLLYLDAINILRILKETSPDIIYQRIGCAYTGISAYYARHNACKMVWHISSDKDVVPYKLKLSRDFLNKFIDKKFMEYGVLNSSHIIAQTQTQSNQLKNNYGRATSAIVKNFHPAPEESVEKKLPNKIVWIANFKKLKQPEIFIKLAQDLTDLENSEFVMIGKTTESRYDVNLLKQIKKIRNLQYLGQLSQAEVNRVLAQAHLLVNTSLWEGFPNTFIQAWMRKVPVVSLHVNPDNIFNDRILGICSGLYDKLKNDIRNLLSDKNLLEYMGECSQSYAFSIHSENNTSEILSIFENCLKHPINEQ